MPSTEHSAAPIPMLDDMSFHPEVLEAAVPVLVEFGAAWCPPCRALEPLLQRLASQGAGRWKVVAVDMDASPALAARYGVRGAPTCIVFSGGVERGRHLGLTREEKLAALVEPWASSAAR